jgi:hypothetical protein
MIAGERRAVIAGNADDTRPTTWAATLVSVSSMDTPPSDKDHAGKGRPEAEPEGPPMAVSIAGISTACSKNALVSSAKAVREALSTE